jgi:hypothetical protein
MALKLETINIKTFNSVLERYEPLVPESLKPLTTFRGDEIIKLVAKRKEDGEAYITKDELVKLVEWKL